MEIKAEDKKYISLYYIKENPMWDGGFPDYEYNNPNRGYELRPPKIDFELNGCGFGDEYFLFEGEKGDPKYEAPKELWDEFIRWVIKRIVQMETYEKDKKNYEQQIGRQLVEFAKCYNAHEMYMLIRKNWVEFRDSYLCVEGCPETVMEFIRGIMHKRMTEKQMWGSEEDRMPRGKVIVFDKNLMPKEGEDTGFLEFEYHPNYREEMLKGIGK